MDDMPATVPDSTSHAGPAGGPCPVCDGHPRILVAIRHPAMRRFTRQLLEREYRCWVATPLGPGDLIAAAVAREPVDLVVVDAADFPPCCRDALADRPATQVIVIGPEPDRSHEQAVMAAGAAAWITRERIGEELGPAMRRVLGCRHDPCPPSEAAGVVPGAARRPA